MRVWDYNSKVWNGLTVLANHVGLCLCIVCRIQMFAACWTAWKPPCDSTNFILRQLVIYEVNCCMDQGQALHYVKHWWIVLPIMQLPQWTCKCYSGKCLLNFTIFLRISQKTLQDTHDYNFQHFLHLSPFVTYLMTLLKMVLRWNSFLFAYHLFCRLCLFSQN